MLKRTLKAIALATLFLSLEYWALAHLHDTQKYLSPFNDIVWLPIVYLPIAIFTLNIVCYRVFDLRTHLEGAFLRNLFATGTWGLWVMLVVAVTGVLIHHVDEAEYFTASDFVPWGVVVFSAMLLLPAWWLRALILFADFSPSPEEPKPAGLRSEPRTDTSEDSSGEASPDDG